ncbi:unnamed protein product [Paramecium sonneborni]|nr:unnamed protein product [Paramecium sonneborni]
MKILSNMINIFGNPNEYNCPSYLPQIVQFEKRQPKNLSKEILKINGDEIDSLQKMLQYDPNTKISVKDALKHRYITSIKKRNLSKKVMQIIQNKFK